MVRLPLLPSKPTRVIISSQLVGLLDIDRRAMLASARVEQLHHAACAAFDQRPCKVTFRIATVVDDLLAVDADGVAPTIWNACLSDRWMQIGDDSDLNIV